jgi:N-acylneuraminate cytidylyltransferase
MKNIAIIPARGGSKRLPNKNILVLGGIPLIAHSILEAQRNSAVIDEVYVSTDSIQIKEIALSYGAKVIDRPAQLSGDLEPTVTALKNVLESIETEVDAVFVLQPTNPLRPANLIADAYKNYIENKADSLMTVTRNHQKFGKIVNTIFVPFNYTIGQRSQDLEPLYFENGLLYIIQSELILAEKLTGVSPFPMIVDHPFANVDIDTQEDFDYAEYLISKSKFYNLK